MHLGQVITATGGLASTSAMGEGVTESQFAKWPAAYIGANPAGSGMSPRQPVAVAGSGGMRSKL